MVKLDRLKVLVVARMTPRLNSRTRTLIRALSEGGYQVDAVSESWDKVTPGVYEIDGGSVEEVVLPLPNRRLWYLSGALRVLVLNLIGIWRVIRHHYNIVVCSDGTYIGPGLTARLLGRSFVYNAHEIMWALGGSPTLATIGAWLERLAIQFCNFWLVPSEARAQIILNKHNIDRKYIVYENFPTHLGGAENSDEYREHLFEKGVPRDRPIFFFQGSLAEKRGLEQIIDVAKMSDKFHLVIQGNGLLLPVIRANQHVNMTLLEPCPNDEAISWLSAADLSFVYYENDCLNSAYACSSKFYVSVFAGIPVLCNRLPAFELFASEYGGTAFVDSLERDAINRALSLLFDDPDMLTHLKREMVAARDILIKQPREELILAAFAGLKTWVRIGDAS